MTKRRTYGQIALTVIYLLLALNAWAQVVLVPLGRSGDPLVLTVLQFLIGAASLAAAWGSWNGTTWAPLGAVIHGLVTGGMLAALGAILGLPGDERFGLYIAAAAVMLWDLAFAWYLHRISRRSQTALV